MTNYMVDRGGDAVLGTFAAMGRSGAGAVWVMSVEDGIYEVTFSVGDKHADGGGRLTIQGSRVLWARDPVIITGSPSRGLPAGQYRSGLTFVTVQGGLLRIGSQDGSDDVALNYIRIRSHGLDVTPRTFFVGQYNIPVSLASVVGAEF
jgi:hypothetical protein